MVGDCRQRLKELADQTAHCVVTSPPYFGLRDYGVDGQIGLEVSPLAFVEEMVAVFGEVWRVLRDDGTLWLNLGDSYAHGGCGARDAARWPKQSRNDSMPRDAKRLTGLKPKDLMGMPWRVALALQDAGWYLRQDIIWSKPNPMPESVSDRCTKAHEYIFLMSKRPRYYFDAAALLEPVSPNTNPRISQEAMKKPNGWATSEAYEGQTVGHPTRKSAAASFGVKNNDSFSRSVQMPVELRNKRSVWTVGSQAFSEAHFATYPPALIEPCVLAGCPEGGTVLDPFGGAGTTGMVADRMHRDAILCELNPKYAEMARRRLISDGGMLTRVEME